MIVTFPENVVLPAIAFPLLFAKFSTGLRETTLIAAARWMFLALIVLAFSLGPLRFDEYLRYACAVLLVAPTLAQLGAKRPQNGAWQFIVLTLVGVLLLPVLQGLSFGDERPHVHTLFRWMIAAHIFVGVVNYLPTRYFLPAILVALAQMLVAAEYLPFEAPQPDSATAWAMLSLICAFCWAYRVARTAERREGLDRLWRDFRNAYGLVWGMRVAERMNAAAAQHRWPVEFLWGGIVVKTESGELPADVQHRVERELRSMLRRFVSHDWIARRLEPTR